jgi:hypothetical protein
MKSTMEQVFEVKSSKGICMMKQNQFTEQTSAMNPTNKYQHKEIIIGKFIFLPIGNLH